MVWRHFREQDLLECLNADPPHIGAELVGNTRAIAAWKKLIQARSFSAAVIDADRPTADHRIIGFGAGVFVSPSFAEEELSNPRPGLNARLIAGIDAGQPAVLGDAELRSRNTKGGLDILIIYGYARMTLTPPVIDETRMVLASSLIGLWGGYRLNRLIGEPIGPADRSFAEDSRAWQIIRDFDEFPSQDSDRQWGRGRALAVMTRESTVSIPGTMALALFHRREPVLGLRDSDQQLLSAALVGLTDEGLARELNLKLTAVKRRWLTLFERIADVRPDLLPCDVRLPENGDNNPGKRGRQKRHHLLAYLREHPEELRPTKSARKPRFVRGARDAHARKGSGIPGSITSGSGESGSGSGGGLGGGSRSGSGSGGGKSGSS